MAIILRKKVAKVAKRREGIEKLRKKREKRGSRLGNKRVDKREDKRAFGFRLVGHLEERNSNETEIDCFVSE